MLTSEERSSSVENYVTQTFEPWLSNRKVPPARASAATADLRARLRSLAVRWATPGMVIPLLSPYLEVAIWNHPREVDPFVRAAVTVGVRNSQLEDLHVDDLIAEDDWRELTVDAAHHFAAWGFDVRAREPVGP